MRRLWPRLTSSTFASKKSLCIYCSVMSKSNNGNWLLPSCTAATRKSKLKTATTLSLELSRYYNTNSSLLPIVNTNSDARHLKNTHTGKDSNVNTITCVRFKAKLLADFQRSLASKDVDLIWPIYNDLFDNGLLACVSRRVYHYLISYIINSRASMKNLDRFKTIVEDMLSQGHHLTISEYNALIHWVGGHTVPHRCSQHFTDALKIFEEMQQPYCLVTDKSKPSLGVGTEKRIPKEPIKPDVETFNTLINIAAQLTDLKSAQKLYHDMVFRGLKPDAITYSTLFMALGKIGDVDGIDYLLQRIHEQQQDDLIKSTYIWNTIMAGYAYNGLSERAYDLFDKMKQVNLAQLQYKRSRRQLSRKGKRKKDQCLPEKTGIPRADFETFRIYIDLLLQDNRKEEAVATLFTMQDSFSVKPTVKIYNSLFQSFMQKESFATAGSENTLQTHDSNISIDKALKVDLKKLHQIYQHMVDNRVIPNSETLYTLVSALLDLGDTQGALTVFLNITESHEERHYSGPNVHSTCVATLAEKKAAKLRQRTSSPSTIKIHPLLYARIKRLTSL